MKNSRNIKDIEKEKLRLRIKQLELEKQIRYDWKKLKEDLSPRSFIKHKLESFAHKNTEGSILFEVIKYGLKRF